MLHRKATRTGGAGRATANLTLTVDADLLRRARIRALERGTSVNAVVREYLESFTGDRPGDAALKTFRELAATYSAGTPGRGRQWSREDVHDRRPSASE